MSILTIEHGSRSPPGSFSPVNSQVSTKGKITSDHGRLLASPVWSSIQSAGNSVSAFRKVSNMGLDMYLLAHKYIGGWNHSSPTEKALFKAVRDALGLQEGDITDQSPSITVGCKVAYWRKANAIHQWFVDNVQSGEDECKPHYVSREQLQALVKICKDVLMDSSKAADLLPPQGGCFFGSLDIDEGYMDDLRGTVKQIEAALNNKRFEDFDFEYQSSW